MKSSNFDHKLVFGILGVVYSVLGLVFLIVAAAMAGGIQQMFILPEPHLPFAILGAVFAVLGIVFLVVTLFFIRGDKRRVQLREELLTWGARVKGEVVDVRVDYSIRVNRRSPVIAKVRCTLPSGEAILRSHRLWDHAPAVGDTVEVLYDPMNEKRYVMEFQQK